MKLIKYNRIYIILILTALIIFNVIIPVKASTIGLLKVHFIDVGDADCMLIQQGDKTMLIDAGNNSDEAVIKKYLLKHEVNRLDIVMGTHADEDHIGSLDAVINNFEVGKVYMPGYNISTKYVEDVMKAVNKKGLQITTPAPGESFSFGDAVCTILAPVFTGYEKENNYSIVLKIQYGNTSFLLTGDAESVSEKDMMRRGYDLSANVLKLGHHGSISSTTNEFLERIKPQYAVISVGKNNKYRHPHRSTMKKLKEKKIKVYRTDENGTIIAVSDGKNIIFDKKQGSYNYRN